MADPKEFAVEKLTKRRKSGSSFAYKVRWQGYTPKDDTWVSHSGSAFVACERLNVYVYCITYITTENFGMLRLLTCTHTHPLHTHVVHTPHTYAPPQEKEEDLRQGGFGKLVDAYNAANPLTPAQVNTAVLRDYLR